MTDKERAAAKARAEFVVQTLRERYICEGHKLDEELAKKFMRWFDTKMSRNSPPVWEFLQRYNQSYDWIISGSPRGMICTCAADGRK